MTDLLNQYEEAFRDYQSASPARMDFDDRRTKFENARSALSEALNGGIRIPDTMPVLESGEPLPPGQVFEIDQQGHINLLNATLVEPVFSIDTADVLASWAESFTDDQVRLMDLAVGATLHAQGEMEVQIRSEDVTELIERFRIERATLPGNTGWKVKLVRREDSNQGNLDLEG